MRKMQNKTRREQFSSIIRTAGWLNIVYETEAYTDYSEFYGIDTDLFMEYNIKKELQDKFNSTVIDNHMKKIEKSFRKVMTLFTAYGWVDFDSIVMDFYILMKELEEKTEAAEIYIILESFNRLMKEEQIKPTTIQMKKEEAM